jgi:Holliday junction DNA helicase RuvA
MIGKLTGRFSEVSPEGTAILDVHGVGYSVRVPVSMLQELQSKSAKELSLYIHTAVREDAIELYGFRSQDELAFFKLLMGVKGVGPKTALGILNVAEVKALRAGIARGDASALNKVFGIGKRTAERIVVELRDKLAGEKGAAGAVSEDAEVLEALMALGYTAQESRRALSAVASSVAGVHNRLHQALKSLGIPQ